MSTATDARQRLPLPAPTDGTSSAASSTALGPKHGNARLGPHDDGLTPEPLFKKPSSSFSIPSDGTPVVIPLPQAAPSAGAGSSSSTSRRHRQSQSRTNLLIEYFEGSQTNTGHRRRPSLRVRENRPTTANSKTSSRAPTEREYDAGSVVPSVPSIPSRAGTGAGKGASEVRSPTYSWRMVLPADKHAPPQGPDGAVSDVGPRRAHTRGATGAFYHRSRFSESDRTDGRAEPQQEAEDGYQSDYNDDADHPGNLTASEISTMPPDSLLLAAEKSTIVGGGSRLAAPSLPYANPEHAQSYERLKQRVVKKLIDDRRTARAHDGSDDRSKAAGKQPAFESGHVDVYGAQRPGSAYEPAVTGTDDDDDDDGNSIQREPEHMIRGHRRSSSPMSGVSLTSSPQTLEHLHHAIADVLLPEVQRIRASQRRPNSQNRSGNTAGSAAGSPNIVPLTQRALESFNSHISLQDESQAQRERRKRRGTTSRSSPMSQADRIETTPQKPHPPAGADAGAHRGDPAKPTPGSSPHLSDTGRTRHIDTQPVAVPSPLGRPSSLLTPVKNEPYSTPRLHDADSNLNSTHSSPQHVLPGRSPLISPSNNIKRQSMISDRKTASPHGSARARAAMYDNLSANSSPGKGILAETETFFKLAHEENERYRRPTSYENTKYESDSNSRWSSPVKQPNTVQNVNVLNPNVHRPPVVESAAASLVDPSSSGAGSTIDRDRAHDRSDALGLGLSPIPENGQNLNREVTARLPPGSEYLDHPRSTASSAHYQKALSTRPESPLFAPTQSAAAQSATVPRSGAQPSDNSYLDRDANRSPDRLHTSYSLGATALPGSADAVFPEMGYGIDDSVSEVHHYTKQASITPASIDHDEGFGDEKSMTPRFGGATESPHFNAATGHGLDKIESKDIVALMDHLTVRDAQRNARDTEILVTLVRSAAEMRNQFEEMKQFVREQDVKLMRSTDASIQQVLRGPRPPPPSFSPRTKFGKTSSIEVDDSKKPNVLRRALKGLSLNRNHDMAKMEEMLLQLLDDVEELKHGQGMMLDPFHNDPNYQKSQPQYGSGLTSYEQLRAREDPLKSAAESAIAKYDRKEEEKYDQLPRFANSSNNSGERKFRSGPLQSHPAHVFTSPRQGVDEMSANQSRRGSQSTGMESPSHSRSQSMAGLNNTPETKRHSLAASLGVPRISRWSKTTASTAPNEDSLQSDRPTSSRPVSTASTATSASAASAALAARSLRGRPESSHSYDRRSPSPLIPENASINSAASRTSLRQTEDAQFKVHRNSLNLEHPKPRPFPTDLHRHNLESAAHDFDRYHYGAPGSEVSWASQSSMARDISAAQHGSIPALARNVAPRQPAQDPTPVSQKNDYSDKPAAPATKEYLKPEQNGKPPFAGGWFAYDSHQSSNDAMYPSEAHQDVQYPNRVLTVSDLPPAVNTLESHKPCRPLEAIEEIQSVQYSVDDNGGSHISGVNRSSMMDRSRRSPSPSSVSSADTISAVRYNAGESRQNHGQYQNEYQSQSHGQSQNQNHDQSGNRSSLPPRKKEYRDSINSNYSADYVRGTPTPGTTAAAMGYHPGFDHGIPQYYAQPDNNNYRYSGGHGQFSGADLQPVDHSAVSGSSDRNAPRWVHGVSEEEWNDLSSYKSTPAPSETF